ncbi:copper resistance protein CopC [Microbispora corallina]|uniref:Copper resistance protein, CopC family n=1 Tax=Microbispora corallina TaxID=83302 RepID=A0ABQ4FRL6_9ACTN|nr:copper resistance CopC family protein [Microbispora corallina]GIH37450.1 putative copper resistance protein, CopC family [Microbispora corallina]
MKKTSLAAVVAVVVTLLLGMAAAIPAQAHTSLKNSDPQKNAQVQTLRKVTLEFAESVRFPVVVVRGEDGKRYESGDPAVDGPKVSEAVVDAVPPGRYTVAWRVVSQDGHPVEGEIPFTVVGGSSTGGSETAGSVGSPTAVSAAAGQDGSGAQASQSQDDAPASVPGWVWIVIFGLAGIGIGMFISLRKKP